MIFWPKSKLDSDFIFLYLLGFSRIACILLNYIFPGKIKLPSALKIDI